MKKTFCPNSVGCCLAGVGTHKPNPQHVPSLPTPAQASKVSKTTAKLLSSMPPSEFDSPMAKALEGRFEFYVSTYVTPATLKANVRRLDEFLVFGKTLFEHQGRSASERKILGCDTAARLFLVDLADKNLGKTVVPAAAKMIQTHRSLAHPKSVPLHCLKAISYLLDSIKKNIIARDRQAPGLTKVHVTLVLRRWTDSARWDEVMFSAVLGIGFQSCIERCIS